jgi:CheY-like chemotaxis protein
VLQLVVNLCLNAKISIGRAGALDISLGSVEGDGSACMITGQRIVGPWLNLVVADTGSPLPEEMQDKVFEPDLRHAGDDEPGIFRMAAVRRTVTRMGGHMIVETPTSGGNRVSIFFPPIADEYRSSSEDDFDKSESIGEGLRAIVVDDDEQTGALLVDQLSVLGFASERFDGGDRALAFLRNTDGQVDLVVTDQNMPDVRGTDLCQALRRDGITIPVLVYSGFCADLTAENIGEFGGDDFLASPFGLRELNSALGRLLARRKSA